MTARFQNQQQIEAGVAAAASVLILLFAALNSPVLTVLTSAAALAILFFTHRRDSKPSLALKIAVGVFAAAIAGAAVFLIMS